MEIPNKFILHGQEIKVIRKEFDINGSRFGYYDSVREEIILFEKIQIENELVCLSNIQIETTFLHELIHAIQWHIKGSFDEQEAQSYSGLFYEYFKSKT